MSDTLCITIDAIKLLKPDRTRIKSKLTTMTSECESVDSPLVYNLTIRAYDDSTWYYLPPCHYHPDLPLSRQHIPPKNNVQGWSHLLDIASKLPSNHKEIPIGMLFGNNFKHAFRPQEIIDTNHS